MERTRILAKLTGLCLVFAAASCVFGQTPRQEELLNGLKVLLWPDQKADKVTVRLRIHAGSAFDPQGKEGTMQMLADDLFPSEATREFFSEDLGGSLDIVTTYDYIQINASSKPDSFITMLETLSSAVANPAIDKELTAKLRNALAEKLKVSESDTAYVADRAVAARLLGIFPYGRAQMGTTASVQHITFADLIDAKQRFLTADNASIAISGNVDRLLAQKAVRRYFGSWLKSDKPTPTSFRQPDDTAPGLLNVASPQPGVAAVRVALRGTARSGKDFAPAEVYARLLEDRLKARMPAESAANVFVRHEAHVQPGLFVLGFAASKNDVGPGNGKIEANDLITKALADPISDAEVAAARTAASTLWQKHPIEEWWLDADTYKMSSAEAARTAFDKVTITDVRSLVGRLQQQPMAMVLVSTPAK
jgi:predicted Zn-dependent peptidase